MSRNHWIHGQKYIIEFVVLWLMKNPLFRSTPSTELFTRWEFKRYYFAFAEQTESCMLTWKRTNQIGKCWRTKTKFAVPISQPSIYLYTLHTNNAARDSLMKIVIIIVQTVFMKGSENQQVIEKHHNSPKQNSLFMCSNWSDMMKDLRLTIITLIAVLNYNGMLFGNLHVFRHVLRHYLPMRRMQNAIHSYEGLGFYIPKID